MNEVCFIQWKKSHKTNQVIKDIKLIFQKKKNKNKTTAYAASMVIN